MFEAFKLKENNTDIPTAFFCGLSSFLASFFGLYEILNPLMLCMLSEWSFLLYYFQNLRLNYA